MLKVGIVGLGAVGGIHLSAYKTSTRGKVVAVAESNKARLEEADLGEAVGFETVSEMLESTSLDVVAICTPAASHEDLAEQCAKRGINILMEKPLALSPESGKRILKICEDNNVRLSYGSTYRCLPAIIEAQNMIQRGVIGEVELMVEQVVGGKGYENCNAMSFGHYPEGGPGGYPMGIIDHGIHLIDVFSWLSGLKIEKAYGRGNISGKEMRAEFLNLIYDNGAIGSLLYHEGTYSAALPAEGAFSAGAGWDVDGLVPAGRWSRSPSCICVYGRSGALKIMHYANALYHCDRDGITQIPLSSPPPPDHFRVQLDVFLEDITSGRPTTVPGEIGLKALEVALTAFAQTLE
jgi:UDP-N-acetyl-2-amino-2-deoxyglucuronate dehydrogenase